MRRKERRGASFETETWRGRWWGNRTTDKVGEEWMMIAEVDTVTFCRSGWTTEKLACQTGWTSVFRWMTCNWSGVTCRMITRILTVIREGGLGARRRWSRRWCLAVTQIDYNTITLHQLTVMYSSGESTDFCSGSATSSVVVFPAAKTSNVAKNSEKKMVWREEKAFMSICLEIQGSRWMRKKECGRWSRCSLHSKEQREAEEAESNYGHGCDVEAN